MVYDCFIFNNELDLLDIRFNVMNRITDRFVLVESQKNFQGKDKPLYFEENKERYSQFLDKVIHIVVKDFGTPCPIDWDCEKIQREYILDGLKDANDDDIIIISDCDEIPNPNTVLKCMNQPKIKSLRQFNYQYYLNNLAVGRTCTEEQTSKILFMKDIRNNILGAENGIINTIKFNHGTKQTIIPDGGWHFTSCGNIEIVKEKLLSNSFHENETIEIRMDLIKNHDYYKNLKFLWNVQQPLIPLILDYHFPEYIRKNRKKFSHMLKRAYINYDTVMLLYTVFRKLRYLAAHIIRFFVKNPEKREQLLTKLFSYRQIG